MNPPLVPRDLYRLILASDAQIASDKSVFYVRTTLDETSDALLSSIYRVELGAQPIPFTSGKRDGTPRPCPDGTRLAFVGKRGGKNRIYLMSLRGGEAGALTPAYSRIGSLVWSPDGRSIAFTAAVAHDPPTARILRDKVSGAAHIRGLPFKSDEDGLLDGTRKHLFVLDLHGGQPKQLTHGDFEVGAIAWSPDGKLLAFAAQIDQTESSFLSDIFVVACAGGNLRKLTSSNGPMSCPSFSHDGREIAFLGHQHGDVAGGRYHTELLVVGVSDARVRSLSESCDRTVGNVIIGDARGAFAAQAPVWSRDDAALFVLVSWGGACWIVSFARDGTGGEASRRIVVGGQRDVHMFSRATDGTLAFVYSEPLVPSEVALCKTDGNWYTLTRNNPWLDERSITMPRHLTPSADDGTPLDLFILDPTHQQSPLSDDAGSSVIAAPLVIQVHGGPHAAYGFAFLFEFQMLAGHGIGVAYGNPRGSQSYGQRFADGVRGDWGGVDAGDVITLLDAAQRDGKWDPARIGIAGGSYGGFMTTWLLGHCRRFAAGISMRAVNDFVSEVGASDCGWFLEDELDVSWDGGRELFERSAMRAAHQIQVPLLILHSERDYRCPIDQGEQLFTLLRRLGRTNVEFVRFIGDGHSLSRTGKPRNRMLRLRAIAHWFLRHLRPEAVASVADEAGWLFAPLPTERGDNEWTRG